MWRSLAVVVVLSAATGISVEARADALSNSACLSDSCQMCGVGGACFMNALAQCTHPACFLGGAVGGVAGAVAGGVVGPIVFTLPAMVIYPGVDPVVAFIGSIFLGAGLGTLMLGLPGMVIGEMTGRSLCYSDFEPVPGPSSARRMSPSHRR